VEKAVPIHFLLVENKRKKSNFQVFQVLLNWEMGRGIIYNAAFYSPATREESILHLLSN